MYYKETSKIVIINVGNKSSNYLAWPSSCSTHMMQRREGGREGARARAHTHIHTHTHTHTHTHQKIEINIWG